MKKFLYLFAAMALVLGGCDKDHKEEPIKPDPVKVTGVSVAPTSLTLEIGETSTLIATVSPSDAEDKSVSWTTSDAAVASVSTGGVVTANAAGSATITVTTTDGSKTATCSVQVAAPEEPEPDPTLATDHFTIDGATYKEEAIPEATIEDTFLSVVVTGAEEGTQSHIEASSNVPLVEFYVGVKDVEGHYVVEAVPVTAPTRAEGDIHNYKFVLNLSEKFDSERTVHISALTEEDHILTQHVQNIAPGGDPVIDEPVYFSVTVEAGDGGSAVPDMEEAEEGDTVTIRATASEGYEFVSWSAPEGVELDDETADETTFTMPASDVTISATFREVTPEEPVYFSVTVEAGDGGSAVPDMEEAEEGDTVTIRATPSKGYEFVSWSAPEGVELDDETAEETTFTMPASDVTISATFRALPPEEPDPVYFTIEVTAGEGGSAVPDMEEAEEGDTVTIRATASEGYEFVIWSASDGVALNEETAEETTFVMPAKNVAISATFSEIVVAEPTYAVVIGDSTGTGEGDAAVTDPSTGHDAIEAGVIVSILATPQEGSVFTGWVADSSNIEFDDINSPSTTFQMPAGEVTIHATFAAELGISFAYDGTGEGTAYAAKVTRGAWNGGGYDEVITPVIVALEGDEITIFATPEAGSAFAGWTSDVALGSQIDARTTFTMPAGAVEITATFDEIVLTYNVEATLKSGSEGMGSVQASHETEVSQGTEVSVTATPAVGHQFVKWAVTSGTVALKPSDESATATFTMPAEDVSLEAEFRVGLYTASPKHPTEASSMGGQASITDAGSNGSLVPLSGDPTRDEAQGVQMGDQVEITALPNEGWEFVEWKVATGGPLTFLTETTANPATFQMPGNDVEIEPVFRAVTYKITATVDDPLKGSATVNGQDNVTLAPKSDFTLQATAEEGYIFSEWEIEGIEVSSAPNLKANPLSFDFWGIAASATEIVATAIFVEDSGVRTITVPDGVTSDFSENLAGETITLTATAPAGKYLKSYTVTGGGGEQIDLTFDTKAVNNKVSFTMPDADVEVTVEWADIVVDNDDKTINGLKWMSRNMNGGKTPAAQPQSVGKHYQFGVDAAWNLTDNTAPGTWYTSVQYVNLWAGTEHEANNEMGWDFATTPCPDGYYVPSRGDFETLLDRAVVAYVFSDIDGQKGAYFVERSSGNAIFMPAANLRSSASASTPISTNNGMGYYWSRDYDDGPETPRHLAISSTSTKDSGNGETWAYSVRCVAYLQ